MCKVKVTQNTRGSGRVACRAHVHTKQGAELQKPSVPTTRRENNREGQDASWRARTCLSLLPHHWGWALSHKIGPLPHIVWLPPSHLSKQASEMLSLVEQALYHVAIARKSSAVSDIDVMLPPQVSPWVCPAGRERETRVGSVCCGCCVLCGGSVMRAAE